MEIVENRSVDKAPMLEKVTILDDPSSQIDAICLSDSSNLLAVSASRIFANTWGGTLKVFKSSTDRAFVEAEEVELTGGNCASLIFVKALKSNAPETIVAASDSGDISIWNCEENGRNLACQKSFAAHEKVVSCLAACKSQSMSFFSGSYDSSVKFWNADRLIRKFQGHQAPVGCIASCDGVRLSSASVTLCVSGGFDKCAYVWDLRASELAISLSADANINSLDWNSDICENIITTGDGDGQTSVYDIRLPFQPLFKFQKSKGSIGCIASLGRNADSGARYAIGSDDMSCALIDSKISTSFDDQDFSKNEEEYMLADDLSSPYVLEAINECILKDHVDYIRALAWNKLNGNLLSAGWDGRILCYKV